MLAAGRTEQGFRSCLGMLRLLRGLDAAGEAVSCRAVEVGVLTMQCRLDPQTPARQSTPRKRGRGASIARKHRGSGYFHEENNIVGHRTLDRLRELGLTVWQRASRSRGQSRKPCLEHAEWLGLLVDQEVTLRQQKRFEAAHAPQAAASRTRGCRLRKPRGLDGRCSCTASCDWIREHGIA